VARFVTGIESPRHCPARPTYEERSKGGSGYYRNYAGLAYGRFVPTEYTRYRRCRRHLKESSDFPGDSLLHTGTHVCYAGGGLALITNVGASVEKGRGELLVCGL
jgi:hypothetical protein